MYHIGCVAALVYAQQGPVDESWWGARRRPYYWQALGEVKEQRAATCVRCCSDVLLADFSVVASCLRMLGVRVFHHQALPGFV